MMEMPPFQTDFVYEPNHPLNVAARANDPDDGIDYDEIIMETEASFRAGRGLRFASFAELEAWIEGIGQAVTPHSPDGCGNS